MARVFLDGAVDASRGSKPTVGNPADRAGVRPRPGAGLPGSRDGPSPYRGGWSDGDDRVPRLARAVSPLGPAPHGAAGRAGGVRRGDVLGPLPPLDRAAGPERLRLG